jgi:polysaccharide pyruvyl transferase WcaK-like protein
MIAHDQRPTLTKDASEDAPVPAPPPSLSFIPFSGSGPRIALLTPYTGGNFGDAAIQDSMIANLRQRLPNAQFSGISLNCENYLARHGSRAFPLTASSNPYYGMSPAPPSAAQNSEPRDGASSSSSSFKAAFRRIPGAHHLASAVKSWLSGPRNEFRHWTAGRKLLRSHDLLVICGGGQLDDEWGGPWGHPYALFKWTLLAKLTGVPCVMTSLGAGKISSPTSRFFLSRALRLSSFRSYREADTRSIAAGLFPCAANDAVIPDLAFSLPSEEIPEAASRLHSAQDRPVVAISPIVFGKPGVWPSADRDLYHRYLDQLAQAISQLLARKYSLMFVCSARGDNTVIPELLLRLDNAAKTSLQQQASFPETANWKDLLATLQAADFLIASRLHSTIFGFLAQTPLVALSFDPKVNWVMNDLGQSDSLLQIANFTASAVIETLARLESRKPEIVQQFAAYRQQALQRSAAQFDTVAQMAVAHATQSA